MINLKVIYKIIGSLLFIEAALMSVCLIMAMAYGEDDMYAFLFQNRELGRLERLQLARLALLLRLEGGEGVYQSVALLLEMLKGAVFRFDLFVILVDSTLNVLGTFGIAYSSVREADSASC